MHPAFSKLHRCRRCKCWLTLAKYLGAPSCGVRGDAGDSLTEPLDIDADDWDLRVNRSSMPVLVDFWHEACVRCKHMDPVYSQLAGEFSSKLKFAKLNVLSSEKNNQTAGVEGED